MEKLNCIWVSERGRSEKAINCLIPVTWHGKAEAPTTVKDHCLPGTWRGAQGTFMKLFCMRLPWWMHAIIPLSKPIEYTAVRGKSNANYGL